MVYNTTILNNVTSPLDFATEISSLIQYPYLIGNSILIVFFLTCVTIFMSKQEDFIPVLITASFLTSILAVLLYLSQQMVSAGTIIYPVGLCSITLVIYFFTKGR